MILQKNSMTRVTEAPTEQRKLGHPSGIAASNTGREGWLRLGRGSSGLSHGGIGGGKNVFFCDRHT